MNPPQKRLLSWLLAIAGLMLGGILWLTWSGSATPAIGQHGQSPRQLPIPTEIPVFPTSAAPTPTPLPQLQPIVLLQDPSPDARVRLGPIATASELPTTPVTWTVRTAEFEGERRMMQHLILEHVFTGEKIRLGADEGSAQLYDMNDRYAIWRYRCYECTPQSTLRGGFYAYDLATRQQIQLLDSGEAIGVSGMKVTGAWVVSFTPQEGNPNYEGPLIARHIETGETRQVVNLLRVYREHSADKSTAPDDLFAVGNGQVVYWQHGGIHLYDLTTETTRILDVPDAIDQPDNHYPVLVPALGPPTPLRFSMADGIVVWFVNDYTKGWWGYDLAYDELFPIANVIPPGWEGVNALSPHRMVVHDGQIYWDLFILIEAGRRESYYFTAPIIRDE